MKLRQTTREIIQLVEDVSGIPVQVTEDPRLQTLASVRMARKSDLPQHLIVFKSEIGEPPDYQICFQCGYIIRLFENPPDKRFDMVETQLGRDEVEDSIKKPGGIADKFRMRKAQISDLRNQFLSGLLIHLRSVPVGLRIIGWLTSNYPELDDLKNKHVQKEININMQSLADDVKMITPPQIYDATQSISAAYAIYWSEKYNKAAWSNPYHQQRYLLPGHELLDIYNEIPDDPTNDVQLIEAWGKHLQIKDWFTFIPYSSGSEH